MTTWQDLVAAAVPGTGRRPVAVSGTLGGAVSLDALDGSPAERVLGAAALLTMGRRAGAQPLTPGTLSGSPAPVDAEPAPRHLGAWLAELAADDPGLLPETVTGVLERGLLVPPSVVPLVLDLGLAGQLSASAAVRVCGQRGRWLAPQRADWARLLARADLEASDSAESAEPTEATSGDPAGEPAGGGPASGSAGEPAGGEDDLQVDDESTWRTGLLDERLLWLRRCRRERPARARALVAEAFAPRGETAQGREQITRLVGETFTPDDEAFLEAALDDRAQGVRHRAAEGLTAARGTAYQRRAAARLDRWVTRRERGVLVTTVELVVQPPEALDAAAIRDGIDRNVPRAAGDLITRALWLLATLEATPLDHWRGLGTPAEVVALPIDGFDRVLRDGWVRRTVLESDRAWADALLGCDEPVPGPERLAALATPEVLQRHCRLLLTTALTSRDDATTVLRWLTDLPHPWPEGIGSALLDALPRLSRLTDAAAWRPVFRGIALHGPPTAAPWVEAAAARVPDWRGLLLQTGTTLRRRHRIAETLDELARAHAASGASGASGSTSLTPDPPP